VSSRSDSTAVAHDVGERLHLEEVPAYAPELNPVEGLWNYLKRVELGNLCCTDLTTLGQAFRHGKERVRHKKGSATP
jgi:transposase